MCKHKQCYFYNFETDKMWFLQCVNMHNMIGKKCQHKQYDFYNV